MPQKSANGKGRRQFAEVLNRRYELDVVIERDARIDEEKRTVDLSISSDAPIDHWFGRIILDHAPGSVRMDRMASGAPLLLNHSVDKQIGVLEDARLEGGKMRATARFSRSALADEIFQDIKDGIRRGTSAGFILHELDLEQKSDKGPNTYRSRDWEPLEASIASVPRDISVGVGRGETEEEENAAGDDEDQEPDANDPNEPGEDEADEERGKKRSARAAQIPKIERSITMETQPTQPTNPFEAMLARTNSYVSFAVGFGNSEERKAELEEMAREFALTSKSETDLFTAINEKRSAWKTAVPPAAPLVTLTDAERKQYSIARAILVDANSRDADYRGKETACFELEISQEIRSKLNAPGAKDHGGFFMPTSIALRGMMLERAGLDTKTATKGQELVFTEPGSFIEMLRNRAQVIRLGATVLPGLQGNVAFPRQTGAGTFTWVGENPGADVADSNLLLDQVVLSPKTGQSSTSYSRQLLQQGVTNIDSLVQNDLVQINALAIDLAALHGAGAPAPTGLYTLTGVNAVAMGGSITSAAIIALETSVAVANADVGTMGYLTTPEIRGRGKAAAWIANTIGM